MCAPVKYKQDFYRRWREGEFGNRGHSWDTVKATLSSGLPGPFAIRYRVPGSRWMRYTIPREELQAATDEFIADGADLELMEYSPMQPDDKLKLQGEVSEDHRGMNLFYSRDKVPMRKALLSAKQVHGATAERVLDWACDPSSRDDIKSMLDNYPKHVIEFSTYDCHVGIIPRRNTVIWEVRQY
jgi:hypothetical protein